MPWTSRSQVLLFTNFLCWQHKRELHVNYFTYFFCMVYSLWFLHMFMILSYCCTCVPAFLNFNIWIVDKRFEWKFAAMHYSYFKWPILYTQYYLISNSVSGASIMFIPVVILLMGRNVCFGITVLSIGFEFAYSVWYGNLKCWAIVMLGIQWATGLLQLCH
jgi:hypothetical protein